MAQIVRYVCSARSLGEDALVLPESEICLRIHGKTNTPSPQIPSTGAPRLGRVPHHKNAVYNSLKFTLCFNKEIGTNYNTHFTQILTMNV